MFCHSIVAKTLPTNGDIETSPTLTVKVGMDDNDTLTINFTCPKCIKLPTFFVCDRLTI